MSFSIVQYFGEQSNKCGYCAGINCSRSHGKNISNMGEKKMQCIPLHSFYFYLYARMRHLGMHAYRLSCEDYQELIDRGWRRCGNYCYKPQNDISCCPCYTIKCDAQEFKLSKSHKRILRRMNKFLRDGKREPDEQQQHKQTGQSINGDDDDVGNGGNETEPQPQLPAQKPLVIDVEQVESLVVQAQEEQAKITENLQIQDAKAENGDQCDSSPASKKCKREP